MQGVVRGKLRRERARGASQLEGGPDRELAFPRDLGDARALLEHGRGDGPKAPEQDVEYLGAGKGAGEGKGSGHDRRGSLLLV